MDILTRNMRKASTCQIASDDIDTKRIGGDFHTRCELSTHVIDLVDWFPVL